MTDNVKPKCPAVQPGTLILDAMGREANVERDPRPKPGTLWVRYTDGSGLARISQWSRKFKHRPQQWRAVSQWVKATGLPRAEVLSALRGEL